MPYSVSTKYPLFTDNKCFLCPDVIIVNRSSIKTKNTATVTAAVKFIINNFLLLIQRNSADERIRGKPQEPLCRLRYDRSYGTPKP